MPNPSMDLVMDFLNFVTSNGLTMLFYPFAYYMKLLTLCQRGHFCPLLDYLDCLALIIARMSSALELPPLGAGCSCGAVSGCGAGVGSGVAVTVG